MAWAEVVALTWLRAPVRKCCMWVCAYTSLYWFQFIFTHIYTYIIHMSYVCVCVYYIYISSLSFIYRQPPRHPCFVRNLLYLGIWGFQFAEGWGFHPFSEPFFPKSLVVDRLPQGDSKCHHLCTKSSPYVSIVYWLGAKPDLGPSNWWLFQDIHPLAVSRNLGVFGVDPIKTQHLGMFTTHWWFLADLPHSTLQKDPELGWERWASASKPAWYSLIDKSARSAQTLSGSAMR